ncbi:MAG: HAD-IC family P-type ATPase, partial [Geobacteraceae bacterium]|nr:HAD-IC family P-type ATPase [Geobacteraceae bacterium]
MKHTSTLTWHKETTHKILAHLNTSSAGLSSTTAEQRLQLYGENRLPQGQQRTLWNIVLHQFISPLIFILIAAAIASIAIGEPKDAIFIFLVIFINSALGAYQEYNAEKSASSLQQLLKISARVRRDETEQEIASEELVPGDIVVLESGIKVPADVRLCQASNLSIDESFLTGESIAAQKNTQVLPEDTGVAERVNMAFAGATVMSGRGIGVVVETGSSTQVGHIAQKVSKGKSAKPPLIQRMEKFINQITVFILILSVILAIVLRLQGMDFAAIFFFVVALAVSAIPEGLPVALTVALSIATKRMAKRNVIVRKLTSVESLGSCTVIASDKTGTLTVNQQTARKIILPDGTSYSASGEGYNGEGNVRSDTAPEHRIYLEHNPPLEQLLNVAALANEAALYPKGTEWKHYGDAMDVALLGLTYKFGLDPDEIKKNHPLRANIPYESERKFSAAFCNNEHDEVQIALKGAVDTVLEFCTTMLDASGTRTVDKKEITARAEELALRGYRVLAFATGSWPDFEPREQYADTDIPPLTFTGLVGFVDPLRAEAADSVTSCSKAGIRVLMITGDHPATAGTIAQELGILSDRNNVVTGQMLSATDGPDDPEFARLISSTTVFA